MLFNSLPFAVFLPLVFLLYWFACGRNSKLQNAFLLVASYVFYGWWDCRFLALIAFTSFCTWGSGLLIHRAQISHAQSLSSAKFFCGLNIVVNLAILGVFKYYNFFVTEFVNAVWGAGAETWLISIILPVGISFYTFSALSYTIDLYRGKVAVVKNPVDVFAYLSFFPQLFAGPIGRASELLPQYERKRVFDYSLAVDGLRQMLWGFFKKMVIADNCAKAVDLVWSDYTAFSGSSLLVVAILYSIQIYGDFSGYSDMAIGCAKLFGIKISPNFRFPYFSRNVAEFWRRWHISLNAWFRDYLYIPLGGSREGKFKTIRNTLIIFTVCGFWHGANWTFIAWGLFHGLLFVPRLLTGAQKKESGVVAENTFLPSSREIVQIGITFALITIGWVFFRAPTITEAFGFFEHMFCSGTLLELPRGLNLPREVILFALGMFAIEWFARKYEHALKSIPVRSIVLRWGLYFILACILLQYDGGAEQFIYFQF